MSAHPAERAWAKLCHHCDGIAIGSTVEALHAAGCFALLSAGPQQRGTMAEALGMRSGLFALACKLLQSQGMVWIRDGLVGLTGPGKAWMEAVPLYAGSSARIEQAAGLLRAIVHDEDAPALPETGEAQGRVWHQLHGPLAAACAFGLHSTGQFAHLLAAPQRLSGAHLHAARVLQSVGWTTLDGSMVRLTPEGAQAAAFASTYAQLIAYFPTFAVVAHLLRQGIPRETDQKEWHVERELDIASSGEVVNRGVGKAAAECILPLFDAADLSAQPHAIVDTGSGDGTLLAVLFDAIRTRTRRGRALEAWPLRLIGVEFTEVARRATQDRLGALPTPSLTLTGDIGEPAAIAASLQSIGLDARSVLHVNKSVIHNRTYRPARHLLSAPPITALFVDPSGEEVAAADIYSGLVELFQAWRPLTSRFGMLAIEPHTVDPDLAAQHIGRSLITALDAMQGYSGQLLMEISPFRQAAAAAGYQSRAGTELGTGMVGAATMSITHFMPT